MTKKLKRFDPKSRWVKYQDGLWIQSRKRVFLYWFRFLQIAEQEPNYTVDWSKYKGWGGSNFIVGSKFDEFWKSKWKELFGIKNEGDKPKFPLSTNQPKSDSLRYSLLVYENSHRGSNWDIAKWISKREVSKRASGLTSSSLFFAREDMEGQYSREDKMIIQSRIGRYRTSARKYLSNVCIGQFP